MDENLAKIRHERSKKDFPKLRLDEGEYVEYFFRRAKVCFWTIWTMIFLGVVAVLIGFLLVLINEDSVDAMGQSFLFMILGVMMAVVLISGAITLKVYKGNRLYVTNRRVMQMVMHSPFSTSINIIDLESVEDASFSQNSLMQKLLHYGTFRLSTVGDETTYTFPFSDITTDELAAVTKLITEAKKAKSER